MRVSDPAVAKLIPAYLERRQADLHHLGQALAAGDYATIATIAHGLKGSGGLYSLQPVTQFGAQLETAAQAANCNELKSALNGLKEFLERLEIQ